MRGERALEAGGLEFLRQQGHRGDVMPYLNNDEGSFGYTPPFNLAPSGWFYQNMLTISRFFLAGVFEDVDLRLAVGFKADGNAETGCLVSREDAVAQVRAQWWGRTNSAAGRGHLFEFAVREMYGVN